MAVVYKLELQINSFLCVAAPVPFGHPSTGLSCFNDSSPTAATTPNPPSKFIAGYWLYTCSGPSLIRTGWGKFWISEIVHFEWSSKLMHIKLSIGLD